MQEKKVCKNSRIKKISIVGVIPSFAFQRAKYCALELHRKLPQRFPQPEIIGLLELDWSEKLQQWRQTLGREYWCLRRPVAVFFDDRFIGSDLELIKLMTIGNILIENIPRKNTGFIKDSFRKDYISYLKKTKRIYCYLDICVDDVYVGTLTFQLYNDLVPKTCENFKTLCLGSRGPLLSYRGSRIHRIVKKGWLQGGDIQYKTGGGGYSIFCDPLEDECFGISHDRRGVLSMANAGRNSNGSQFFITLKPGTWMDSHFVAFGQLIEGVNVLKVLENIETMYECPLKKVEIKNCGKLDLGDVEDIDATYKEEAIPKKKKKIETISEQIIRLIMEALTDALARKERAPDILDDGDVASKMNIQLYFQGFYSLPESILEESAKYLRNLRRNLLRDIKPSATEVVEVIMYDLLMAVLTRMTTLDDVEETIGHELYQKMVAGIDMNLELCQKPYVKRLVDQIVSTAESMVDLISKKIQMMKNLLPNLKKFQDQMQNWVQSFVLQETFQGDNYFIADRAGYEAPKTEKPIPKRVGKPCCDAENKKKEEEYLAKLKAKFPPEDICCIGSKLKLEESEINVSDFFSTCRYDLKRVPKNEEDRMPLLDMIEMSRFKLRWMRKQENRKRSQDRICLEKKIRKWMTEVVYTPETSWLREAIFEKDAIAIDHIEEILYGAMTAGLLEMYYFTEEYLKRCGGGEKAKKLVTTTIYPDDYSNEDKKTLKEDFEKNEEFEKSEDFGEKEDVEVEDLENMIKSEHEIEKPPCTCGHPCCKCPFDPAYKVPTLPESVSEQALDDLGEDLGEDLEVVETVSEKPVPEKKKPCASDETMLELNEVMAETANVKPEEIDFKSFRWLKPYILEKGCDLKTQFATQVHKWLEGDRFSYRGFISKHSLPTRASLLSLSFSLAELITEENGLKTDIRNFIYDLWDLYFDEMFKEALLEYPVEPEAVEAAEEGKAKEHEGEVDDGFKEDDASEDDSLKCKKILADTPEFDFSTYCAKFGHEIKSDQKEEIKEAEDEDRELTPPPPLPSPPPPPPPPPPQPIQAGDDDTEIDDDDDEAEKDEEDEKDDQVKAASRHGNEENRTEEKINTSEEPSIKKQRKSPIIIEEWVDASSSEESRKMPPYVLPFWVKFLTELTKQALAEIAKVSRLPRRLYFLSDTDLAFDEKMKDWFEFNAFNPQPTKGREIRDYIAVHHASLTNLEDTARSFLKKKKYSELINRCTRITSADDMAEEIVADVIGSAMKEEPETMELFVSSLVSSAVTSSTVQGYAAAEEEEEEEYNYDTDKRESEAMDEDAD